MSAWKSVAAAAGLTGVLVGGAFATGLVSLDSTAGEPDNDNDNDNDADDNDDGLQSLGYVGAFPIPEDAKEKVGVTRHKPALTAPALNLYNPSGWAPRFLEAGIEPVRGARIIDMEGKLLHEWKSDYVPDKRRGWANARLSPDGYLYGVYARTALVKLDWESNQVWVIRKGFHHDVSFEPDGTVIALLEDMRTIEVDGRRAKILDNAFAEIEPKTGRIKRTLWMSEGMADEPLWHKQFQHAPKHTDIIHANTSRTLNRDIEGIGAKGDFLTALREMNAIAVFDRKTGKLKWIWGNQRLDRPHDPEFLDDGTLLVFDNGMHRKWSRVAKFDIATNEVVWAFKHTKEEPFFSRMRGQVQPLPNGNILVVSSEEGRTFELTPDKEIVWEFYVPDVHKGLRLPLRMTRLGVNSLDELPKPVARKSE